MMYIQIKALLGETQTMSGKEKPRWLLVGGIGMIGRNLVKYLLDNNLASDIRIADKRAPMMASLRCDESARVALAPSPSWGHASLRRTALVC